MNRTPKLSKRIKLLILTADDSPTITNWKNKAGTAKICVCDAKRGQYLSILGLIRNMIPVFLASFVKDELFSTAMVFYENVIHVSQPPRRSFLSKLRCRTD
jgi:hypothetical protein